MELLPEKADVVIIANGRFPKHEIPLGLLQNAACIVCCDGAANEFISRGGIPQAIVGDCDSITQENREKFAAILHQVQSQEINDLTKAVHFCYDRGFKELIIVGGTGKRADHTVGNISLLARYMDKVAVKMVTDYGVFVPIHSSTSFKSVKGQQVSIFSLDQKEISTQGLAYPIENRVLNSWWQGTLNEALGEEFTLKTEGRVIVFRTFT